MQSRSFVQMDFYLGDWGGGAEGKLHVVYFIQPALLSFLKMKEKVKEVGDTRDLGWSVERSSDAVRFDLPRTDALYYQSDPR